jgi:hypothetical protein
MGRLLCGVIMSAALLGCDKENSAPPAQALASAPRLTLIQPDEVMPRGIRIAHIVGEGLDMKRPVTVYFGSAKSPRAAIVSKTKIQVEVPAGADGSDVDVRVEIGGHQPTTLPMKLRYRAAAEPPTAPPEGEAPPALIDREP